MSDEEAPDLSAEEWVIIHLLRDIINSDDKEVLRRLAALGRLTGLAEKSFDFKALMTVVASVDGEPQVDELHTECLSQLMHIQADPAGFPPDVTREILTLSAIRLATSYVTEILDAIRDEDHLSYIAALHAIWVEGFVYRGLLDAELARRIREEEDA